MGAQEKVHILCTRKEHEDIYLASQNNSSKKEEQENGESNLLD